MSQLIVMIGPRRSGLHAVVNWLIGLHPGRVRFVNDPPLHCSPHPENFQGCYEYDVSESRIKLRPTLHLLRFNANQLNWSVAAKLPWPLNGVVRRVMKNFWEPKIMRASCSFPELDAYDQLPPDLHIVLFENLSPREAAEQLPDWLAAYRMQTGLPAVQCEDIFIVLRSPWNCLGSTLKHRLMGVAPDTRPRSFWDILTRAKKGTADVSLRLVPPERIGELWTEYARELTGESRYLQPARWKVHSLPYDVWLETPSRRASVAGELGCASTDLGLAKMAHFGGGSSFVGADHPPENPQKLKDRWRHYQKHPLMHALLCSPDIRRLASTLNFDVPDIA